MHKARIHTLGLLLLVVLPLQGCTHYTGNVATDNTWSNTQAIRIYDGDGNPAWLIQCPGAANTIGSCFNRANVVCRGGYRLLDQGTQRHGTTGIAWRDQGSAQSFAIPNVERQVIIDCNVPQAAPPPASSTVTRRPAEAAAVTGTAQAADQPATAGTIAVLEAPQSDLSDQFEPAYLIAVQARGVRTDVPTATKSIHLDSGEYRVTLAAEGTDEITVSLFIEPGKRHQVAFRVLPNGDLRPVLYRVSPLD